MSLGGGAQHGARHRRHQRDQRRRQLRDRRGQLERERVQLLAGPRRRRDHGRRDHQHRRALLVLELRDVPRHLRAGLEHHLGLEHERHGDEHDQRDVDGDAARRGRDRALPADEPRRLAGDRDAGARSTTRRRTRSRTPAPARPTGSCTRSSARPHRRHRLRRPHHRRLRRHRRRRRAAELIVNGGFEGSSSPWTLSGDAYWSTGGVSALGHRLLHPRGVQQRERQRVPDGDHPVERRREPHVLAQHHDERGVLHSLRPHVRRGAEHVGHAARDGWHVDERQLRADRGTTRRSRPAWRPGEARRCGSSSAPRPTSACRRASGSTTSR